jgi:hypothetical protein
VIDLAIVEIVETAAGNAHLVGVAVPCRRLAVVNTPHARMTAVIVIATATATATVTMTTDAALEPLMIATETEKWKTTVDVTTNKRMAQMESSVKVCRERG